MSADAGHRPATQWGEKTHPEYTPTETVSETEPRDDGWFDATAAFQMFLPKVPAALPSDQSRGILSRFSFFRPDSSSAVALPTPDAVRETIALVANTPFLKEMALHGMHAAINYDSKQISEIERHTALFDSESQLDADTYGDDEGGFTDPDDENNDEGRQTSRPSDGG